MLSLTSFSMEVLMQNDVNVTECESCGRKWHGLHHDVECQCGCTINCVGQVIENPNGDDDERYFLEEEQ